MRSEHIQQQLVSHGRSAATPIAIIERGTTARQRVLTGTLADLAELAAQAVSPSLIVIGEVVALRESGSPGLARGSRAPATQAGEPGLSAGGDIHRFDGAATAAPN